MVLKSSLGGLIRASLLMVLLSFSLCAQDAVLRHDGFMMDKSIYKLNEMALELRQKTGINLYFVTMQSLGNQTIAAAAADYEANLSKPYLLLILSRDEKRIDITGTPEALALIDKKRILNDFVIPILVSPNKQDQDKVYGAAVFNGAIEILEEIGKAKNVEFVSSPGSDSYNFIWGLRILFYSMLIFTLYLFVAKRIEQKRQA